MEEYQYRTDLRKVLDEHSADAIKKLNATLQSIPEKSQSIELTIFPDQDGEGSFGVQVSLSGPDLYVLNKAIEASANIFEIKHSPDGLEPDVPMMDPFDSSFEVNDTLSDVVAEWLKSIWDKVDLEHVNLPVTIVADEGYGMNLPIKLN